MPAPTTLSGQSSPQYGGLRMTADEFLQIPDDGHFYELINGVVVVSPSPTPRHQNIAFQIARQLADFLDSHPAGMVFVETDVHLGRKADGGDLLYRPEVLFVRAERVPEIQDRIVGAPDLVVEVISRGSRLIDTRTKKDDYEQFGVREYWLIDPEHESMTFYRLEDGRFVEAAAADDTFASQAVPGFVLDLDRVRKAFRAW